jgi:hypothetical protein
MRTRKKLIVVALVLIFTVILIRFMMPEPVGYYPAFIVDFAVVPDNSVTYLVFICQKGSFGWEEWMGVGYIRIWKENSLVCEEAFSELSVNSGEVKVITLPCRIPNGPLRVNINNIGTVDNVWPKKLIRLVGPSPA